MAGRTAYPLAQFTPPVVFAGVLWASLATMLGYIGGQDFHDQTLLATGLDPAGSYFAIAVTLHAFGFLGVSGEAVSEWPAGSRIDG